MEVGTGTERSGLVDNSVVELTGQNNSKATRPGPSRRIQAQFISSESAFVGAQTVERLTGSTDG